MTTGVDGAWNAVVPATSDLARGEHTITVEFAGTQAHLPADAESRVHVWANLLIQIDEVSQPNFVTRSDGSVNTISFTGSVREIGGTGEVFENLVMYIGNGSDCQGGREGAFCFDVNGLSWTNGNFSLDATAPKELSLIHI